ncbi:lytic murein transglycosylase [Streptomyces californicus]|uniref:lytic murein transglycosylase n=1 Tax=Streptomyces californicus TaxID=67351 RepID=UPI00296F5F53|nr:lytic murein transglycosylase [Streptomyces californicus]MDW4903027.1 lytic murein transglycosylase [Streptomyces californicus]
MGPRTLAARRLAAPCQCPAGFDAQAGSHAGAQGPAQFIPGTWATWGRDADGNGRNDPRDIGDAVTAPCRSTPSPGPRAARYRESRTTRHPPRS